MGEVLGQWFIWLIVSTKEIYIFLKKHKNNTTFSRRSWRKQRLVHVCCMSVDSVLHISLHRFWRTPGIDSTRAQSTRMWPWWPGTLRLTPSTYTRSVATSVRKFPAAETVNQLLCRRTSAGAILVIMSFNDFKKTPPHFFLISVLRVSFELFQLSCFFHY